MKLLGSIWKMSECKIGNKFERLSGDSFGINTKIWKRSWRKIKGRELKEWRK